MNRKEALQAAFDMSGQAVLAEDVIAYAKFLLGEQNTLDLTDRISNTDPRDYSPEKFVYTIGQRVYERNDDIYHVGAVARDYDGDVWVKTEDSWEMYPAKNGVRSERYIGIVGAAQHKAVFVA